MERNIAQVVGSAYENWYGETVFLDCGKGAGQEAFILEQVCPMAAATGKEILYLTNSRRMLAEKERQNRADAEKVLRVMDYAEFEQMVQYHVAYDGQYDYIFAEDCRILLESSLEPAYSSITFDFLMHVQRSAVIFMGADAKALREYLLRIGKLKQENLFVLPQPRLAPDKLVFVQKERGKLTGVKLVQKLLAENGEQRIAYFCSSKEKMRGAAKILKDKANYFYGVDNPESDCTAIEGRLHARRNVLVADGRALFGIHVQDIQCVIADLFDVDCLLRCIQSVGDINSLYVVEYNGTQLRYLRGVYEIQKENLGWFEQMERGEGAEFLRRSQNPRFLTENPVFFIGQADEYGNCRYQINGRQRAFCEIGLAVLDAIAERGYRAWVCQALGAREYNQQQMRLPSFLLSEAERAGMVAYLGRWEGKKVIGEELASLRGRLCDMLGRKSISVSMANTLFQKYGVPYQVESKKERARTSPDYNHHYWKITSIDA